MAKPIKKKLDAETLRRIAEPLTGPGTPGSLFQRGMRPAPGTRPRVASKEAFESITAPVTGKPGITPAVRGVANALRGLGVKTKGRASLNTKVQKTKPLYPPSPLEQARQAGRTAGRGIQRGATALGRLASATAEAAQPGPGRAATAGIKISQVGTLKKLKTKKPW